MGWIFGVLIIVLLGILVFRLVTKDGGGDYDFITPLLGCGVVLGTIVVIIAFLVGKFLF